MLLIDCAGLNIIILIALWDTYHIQGPWTIAWEGSRNVHLHQLKKSTCFCFFVNLKSHVHVFLRYMSMLSSLKKKLFSQHIQISIISKAPCTTLFKQLFTGKRLISFCFSCLRRIYLCMSLQLGLRKIDICQWHWYKH